MAVEVSVSRDDDILMGHEKDFLERPRRQIDRKIAVVPERAAFR